MTRRFSDGAHTPGPIPVKAGIGLRAIHHDEIASGHSQITWLEAHSENYFAAGGPQLAVLTRIRAQYPLSLHGVGLSLGSTDPLSQEHLHKLKGLVDRFEPGLVSEHLSWSSVNERYLNDLLPLPYTQEALRHVASRIQYVQEYLGRQILIENVSSYLEYACSEMAEWEFLAELARKSGCGILLDINNIYVSARNHGFSAREYLDAIPGELVMEFHLAGYSVNQYGDREILVDTHSRRVSEPVWTLFAEAVECIGARPTLIEWDSDIPNLSVLLDEARKANYSLRYGCDVAA